MERAHEENILVKAIGSEVQIPNISGAYTTKLYPEPIRFVFVDVNLQTLCVYSFFESLYIDLITPCSLLLTYHSHTTTPW